MSRSTPRVNPMLIFLKIKTMFLSGRSSLDANLHRWTSWSFSILGLSSDADVKWPRWLLARWFGTNKLCHLKLRRCRTFVNMSKVACGRMAEFRKRKIPLKFVFLLYSGGAMFRIYQQMLMRRRVLWAFLPFHCYSWLLHNANETSPSDPRHWLATLPSVFQ